jgi:hypothetical protein
VGRSDRRDPFFKGLRFAPASDVATIADRSVTRIDLGQSGGYAFASLTGSVVPEPSTWAMMLIGFGWLGLAAYSRRNSFAAKRA